MSFNFDACNPIILNIKANYFLRETNLSTKLNNFLTHSFDNTYQAKGSNMWLSYIMNFFGGARFDEFSNDFTAVKLRIFNLTP